MPPNVRIFVCLQPVDFRRSFDGLAQTTREILHKDPQSGARIVFVNKRKIESRLYGGIKPDTAYSINDCIRR